MRGIRSSMIQCIIGFDPLAHRCFYIYQKSTINRWKLMLFRGSRNRVRDMAVADQLNKLLNLYILKRWTAAINRAFHEVKIRSRYRSSNNGILEWTVTILFSFS